MFAHVYHRKGMSEEQILLDVLDGMGRRRDEAHAPGAAAYLYDLRIPTATAGAD